MPEVRSTPATYTNPVYRLSFPDPFVLKHKGEYFAYSTGDAPDRRVFAILSSKDLVNWKHAGSAMARLSEPHPHYWAPEVTYYNGKFYLYYSVGNETLMHIRVAVAEAPDGDFIDQGLALTKEEFAIDPHIVREPNGQLYMFYATDFLEHTHVGTGTVVDRMIDPFSLAGRPRPVTRARYDWQVYDPARKEKGGVRWHTVEGPFVLKRKGLYYEMFSGGNWQNETYGVSFAVSDTIEREDEWQQYSDGHTTLPVLRTIPDRVRGPGHNSVVRGPNNRELYCVYHRWDKDGRVLAIDRMDMAGEGRIFVIGPTDSPQIFPFLPERISASRDLKSGLWQTVSGNWTVDGTGVLAANGAEANEIVFELGQGTDIYCETNIEAAEREGAIGIRLKAGEIDIFTFAFDAERGSAWSEWSGSGGPRTFSLPPGFDASTAHDLAIDIEHETVNIIVDGGDLAVTAVLPTKPSSVGLFSEGVAGRFGPVDVTIGFEELFDRGDMFKRGWDHYANRGTLNMNGGLLRMKGVGEDTAIITRNVQPGTFQLCINLRFAAIEGDDPACTIECGNLFTILGGPNARLESEGERFELPSDYDPMRSSQFRIVCMGGMADIFLESVHLGAVPSQEGEYIRIAAKDSQVELDMVRYTVIK